MEIRQHLQRLQVTARQLAQLIGKLHAPSQAVLSAPLSTGRYKETFTEFYTSPTKTTMYWFPCQLKPWKNLPGGRRLLNGMARLCCASHRLLPLHQIYLSRVGEQSAMVPEQETHGATRSRNAHKLPRVTGSNSSSKDLSEGSDRAISTVTIKQL